MLSPAQGFLTSHTITMPTSLGYGTGVFGFPQSNLGWSNSVVFVS